MNKQEKTALIADIHERLRGSSLAVTPEYPGLTVGEDDRPRGALKAMGRGYEQNDKLKITGGVLDGAVMPATTVSALAKLPSREVLLAQLLGLINAPASQLLRTIQEPGAQVARLLGALERSKREAGGGAASEADQSAPTTIEAENQEPVKEDSSHD